MILLANLAVLAFAWLLGSSGMPMVPGMIVAAILLAIVDVWAARRTPRKQSWDEFIAMKKRLAAARGLTLDEAAEQDAKLWMATGRNG